MDPPFLSAETAQWQLCLECLAFHRKDLPLQLACKGEYSILIGLYQSFARYSLAYIINSASDVMRRISGDSNALGPGGNGRIPEVPLLHIGI